MSCKIARNVLAAAVLTASFGAAHAIPTTLTEPLTLNSIEADVDTGDASFAYDLNSYGYDPLLHSLESALLSLVFAVSGRNANQIANANASIVTVSLPGQDDFSRSVASFNAGTELVPITFEALNLVDGILDFSLTRSPNPGGVLLTSATLTVSVLPLAPNDSGGVTGGGGIDLIPLSAVPEPGTLALLGISLLGGTLVRRRIA